jgi:Tfp pilus assembly protein PilN
MAEAGKRSGSKWRRFGYYLLTAVIVVCVVLFLVGRYQLGKATDIRRRAEAQLTQATIYIAGQALQAGLAAQRDVSARNWGSARSDMGRVLDGVQVMEQVAPGSMQSRVRDLKKTVAEAQTAVSESSDDSLARITKVLESLQGIKEKATGG